jgi:hypothetical protein
MRLFIKPVILYDKMLNAKINSSDNIIEYEKNRSSLSNSTSNFTMSVWFYIDEWSQNNKERNILYFSPKEITQEQVFSSTNISGIMPDGSSDLSVKLGKYSNDIFVDIKTTSETLRSSIITRYSVNNVPIQKWNCLTISVDSKTMDIYLGGKLVKSYILPGIFKSLENNIYLGQGTYNIGFDGYITRVRYLTHFINPEESYQIYRDGINSSLARSLFNKYRLKLSFLEFDKEKGSIII